jgi:hypothetical protein
MLNLVGFVYKHNILSIYEIDREMFEAIYSDSDISLTSSRYKYVVIHARRENVAGMAQGRKYGYSFRKVLLPKRVGKRSAGCDRAPPINGLYSKSKICFSHTPHTSA